MEHYGEVTDMFIIVRINILCELNIEKTIHFENLKAKFKTKYVI